MSTQLKDLVKEITHAVELDGHTLYACYHTAQDGGTIHVLLDDSTAELSMGICISVSRHIDDYLEAKEIDRDHINIEVASPGADRILIEPWHFNQVLNKSITVKTREAVNDQMQKSLRGKLVKATDSHIEVAENKHYTHKISYDNIAKARLMYSKSRREET